VARAPQRSEQRLRRIVTRAPHFKQGREARKGKNERSWIKDTHGLISWTVGYGRHRRTRVRPIGRGGFPHGLTGRTIGLGFIPGPCPPPWRDPACTKKRTPQVPNSGRRDESWDWRRWMIDECIWETRDSLRSSVAPISFIVNSS